MTVDRPCRRALNALVKLPVHAYRLTLSAYVGHSCRYHPTCSVYALEAIDNHGPVRGVWLTLRRIARCNPWGGHGVDPVPPAKAPNQRAL